MSILVVGSVALDYLETPFGKMERALGGSATFISVAASYLSDNVRMVGIVGVDFPEEHVEFFRSKGITLDGLVRATEGKTFSWGGRYHEDMNNRDTLYTELGVFETFSPEIPDHWRQSDYVVLGNIHPSLQQHVLDQISNPKLIICDTMNLWINISRDALLQTISRVNVLLLNDQEAKQLTDEKNLFTAGKKILAMGPKYVLIKKGEHGAILMSGSKMFFAPAVPLEAILDPTGAGDTFAGGFIGYIARTNELRFEDMKRAVLYGSVLASFCVEKFGVEGLRTISDAMIEERYEYLKSLSSIDSDCEA